MDKDRAETTRPSSSSTRGSFGYVRTKTDPGEKAGKERAARKKKKRETWGGEILFSQGSLSEKLSPTGEIGKRPISKKTRRTGSTRKRTEGQRQKVPRF